MISEIFDEIRKFASAILSARSLKDAASLDSRTRTFARVLIHCCGLSRTHLVGRSDPHDGFTSRGVETRVTATSGG